MAGVLKYLNVELRLQAENFNNGLKASQRELKEWEKTIKPSTMLLQDIGSAAKTAGAALSVALTAPIAAAAGVGIAFNAMQEQAHIAFTTMLGDGKKASQFLHELKDFAATTPFEFPDLVRGAQRLMAMGFAAKDVKPLLTAVGNAAAGLGGGAAEIDRITLALGQMAGRGRVATQEMNQLTEVGIPAWKILADRFGVAETKIRDMVEKGLIPANEAIDALVAGMNEKFGGQLEKQAQSFKGLVSTIADESRFLAGELTDGLFNALKGPASTLAGFLHDLRVRLDDMGDGTKAAIAIIAGGAAAIGPTVFIFGQLAQSVNSIVLLAPKLQMAFAAINGGAILATGGVIGLGAAIGYAIGQLVNLGLEATGTQKAFDKLLASLVNTLPIVGNWATGQNAIRQSTESTNLANQKFIERLKALGIEFDAARLADDKYKDSLIRLIAEHDRTTVSAKNMADAHKGAQKPLVDLGIAGKEAEAALRSFRSAVDSLKNSVVPSSSDIRTLNQAIIELQAAGVPAEMVLDHLGKRAMDMAVSMRTLGQEVPPAIDAIAKAQAKLRINEIITANTAALQRELQKQEDEWERHLDKVNAAYAKSLDERMRMEKYWEQQLEDFRNRTAIPEEVKAGERAADQKVRIIIEEQDRIKKETKRQSEEWRRVWSTAMGNVVHDFVKGLTDIIWEGGNFVDKLKGIGKQAGKTFTEAFLLELTAPLTKFFESLGKKLADALSNALIGSQENGGGLSGLLSKIPGINRLPGIGNTGGGGLPGSGSPDPEGGTQGAAAGGAAGIINTVLSGLSIMQQKRLEGTMNAVEYNTRHQYINFDIFFQEVGWPLRDNMIWTREAVQTMVNQLDAIYNRMWDAAAFIAKSIPAAVPKMATGGFIEQSGLVYAHAGETIIPASGGGGGGGVTLHFDGPLVTVEAPITVTSKMDRRTVRDDILPEFLDAIETGVNGARAKLTEIVASTMDGIVSTRIRRK